MKTRYLIAAKLIIAVGLFAIILAAADLKALGAQAARVTVPTLAMLSLLVLAQAGLLSLRWCIITSETQHKLPFWSGYAGTLVSFFFSQGLPSSIGGDALRIWWMRRHQVSVGEASKSVLYDRVAGLVTLLIVCGFSILILSTRVGGESWDVLRPVLVVTVTTGLVCVCFLFLPFRFGFSDRGRAVAHRFPRPAARVLLWLIEFREMFLNMPATTVLVVGSLGITVHMATILMGYLIAMDLGIDIDFIDCIGTVAPAMLISYLPFSIAGWGVREASIVGTFSLIGISVEAALTVSLVIGCSVLATSLLGGVAWVLGGWREAWLRTDGRQAVNVPGRT